MTVATCPGATKASKRGRAALEELRDDGPGSPPGEQHRQVVRRALRQHRGARRCRGFESGRQEHHGPLRVLLRDAHRIERARDRTDIRAGSLRLLERARLVARPVDRHAQHVAVRDEE